MLMRAVPVEESPMRVDVGAVVLAAGLGTRMKSARPKVLHHLGGRPLLLWAVESARQAIEVGKLVVVIGPEVKSAVENLLGPQTALALQARRLGTGHAVLQAAGELSGVGLILVTSADMPLLRPETLRELIETQRQARGPLTLLSVQTDSPRGFGRILRDAAGQATGVIEEAVATPEQLQLREVNAGAYCLRGDWLWDALRRLPVSPKGEYYLTDLAVMAATEPGGVSVVGTQDPVEVIGINTREHLAEAEAGLRQRILRRWMLAGVTVQDPASTYIGPEVTLGADTVVLANTHLEGKTHIGANCTLGPNTLIRDSNLGDGCTVEASVLEGARLEEEVEIGPFAHLRPGAHLMRGVHMGNFGEVKDSTLGPGTKMGHFSYIGNAEIGAGVNIGAGTITCNYDGERKNPTTIGEGAFIGSDTMLVAPVEVGKGAHTGAGAVVTKNVPDDSVAVGMPARVIRKVKRS
jgi:bifunctional UDP-N-acetylglucosamine pyrophosphorylase / glucosamine-1-phosphate N-acetyltransferase